MGDTKKDEVFVLEKHLHKQYATNAQANTGNFIAFLVAVLAMFYAFGYVYVFNSNSFASGGVLFVEKTGEHVCFTLDVLLIISSISLLMLTFLIVYCMNLGWQQRRDHIIVTRIRENRMTEQERKNLFGDQYSPYEKNCFKFIPNVYRYYLYLFIIAAIFIIVMTLIKVCSNIRIFPFWFFIGSTLIMILITIVVWICTYNKYKSCCDTMNNKK